MIYGLLKNSLKFFFGLFFRMRILGKENVPFSGPVILAANHMSNWDPPILATYLDRPVSYMAKQELFEVPVLGRAIASCHAFPIKRGAADRAAIKMAIKILKLGNCVGVFPEGTRSQDGKLHKPAAGVALIAALSSVPVVPVALIGTNEIFSHHRAFSRVTVVYGKPMFFSGERSDRNALQEFSQKIMDEIDRMINLNSKDA